MLGKPQSLFICTMFSVCDRCVSREHACFHAQCMSTLFVYVRGNMCAFGQCVFVVTGMCIPSLTPLTQISQP